MQIDIKHPHDSIFKNVFDDINNTKDFLKAKKNYFDLSVDCNIGEKKSRIYILFEHKSYQDKQTIMQILRYCLVLWENELRNNQENLTPIIPFIFYHGEKESGLHQNFRDYFDVDESLKDYILDFRTIIFDTNKIKDSEIREEINHNMFLMSAILLMKNIFGDNLKPIMKTIVELDDERKVMLFEYITLKKDMTEEKFNEMIIDLKGEKMPSLAEIWMERGEQRGEQRGKKIGRLEEIHNTIKIGFESKFSQLSDKLLLAIQNITEIEKLKEIQKALFVINDADEFQQFIKKTI